MQPDINLQGLKRYKALDNAFVENFYDKTSTARQTNAFSEYIRNTGSIVEVHIDTLNTAWNGVNNDVKIQIEMNAIDPEMDEYWIPLGSGISLKDALSGNVLPYETISFPAGVYIRLSAKVQVAQIDENAQGYITAYLILK